MRVDTRIVGDVVVLDLVGKITLGEGDELLKSTVASLMAGGLRKFVLNLQAVPYVDSSGLGELVRTYTIISRQKGRLVLSHPFPPLFDVLLLSKLRERTRSRRQSPTQSQSLSRVSRATPYSMPPVQCAHVLAASGSQCGGFSILGSALPAVSVFASPHLKNRSSRSRTEPRPGYGA